MKSYVYQTLFGEITIAEENGYIIKICFGNQVDSEVQETLLIKEAKRQLDLYFAGNLKEFDLPLASKGTEFQQKVWRALRGVSYGATASYKEIAMKIDNPKACRAVGMANNKNPIVIVVPCHRVIGTNGKLVGYAGGLDIKNKLLKLENFIVMM